MADSSKNQENPMEISGTYKFFTMSQGACFGRCPVYSLTLYSDSTLQLEGKQFMNYIGFFKRKLDNDQYSTLITKYKNLNIDSLKTEYDAGIADYPSQFIYFFSPDGRVMKKVRNSGNAPQKLDELISTLRPYINEMGWEKDMSYDSTNQNQLILTLKDKGDLNRILESYKRYDLSVSRIISKDNQIYLVTFDDSKIKPSQMIGVLKSDENVMYAERNPKLDSNR
jgi:hypothetical protein